MTEKKELTPTSVSFIFPDGRVDFVAVHGRKGRWVYSAIVYDSLGYLVSQLEPYNVNWLTAKRARSVLKKFGRPK